MTAETAPFPIRTLRALGLRALETALNRVVALDPDTRAKLQELDGRRVQLHLDGPGLDIGIRAVGGRLQVDAGESATDATLRVSSTPGGLLGMALRGDRDGLPAGTLEVAGDAGLAHQLGKLARHYRPDFEAAFARVFGDVLGVPLARTVHAALLHVRESAAHAVEDGGDWLRDEARLAVAPGEVEDFLDDVDALQARVQALDARIRQLRGNGTDAQ